MKQKSRGRKEKRKLFNVLILQSCIESTLNPAKLSLTNTFTFHLYITDR